MFVFINFIYLQENIYMKTNLISPNLYFYLGLIAFGFGITALSVPDFTIKTLIIILGSIITAGGIGIFIYKLRKKSEKAFIHSSQLILSVLNIAFGIVLISLPDLFIDALIIVLGVLLVMAGILNLIIIIGIRPLSNFGKMFVGLALIMLISGVIFIFNPFGTAKAITVFFGIILSIYGLSNIMMSFWLRAENLKNIKLKQETIEIEAEVIDTEPKDTNEAKEPNQEENK